MMDCESVLGLSYMKILDKNNWNRKEHFEFFSRYDNPFFGLVTEVDCTKAYELSKQAGVSFFAYYLYQSITAANQIEEFKYRIQGSDVVVFDEIHAASTLGRKDGTFAFSFMPFSNDFTIFKQSLHKEMEAVAQSTGLRANEEAYRADVIHYSSLPWNKFTGLTHARSFNTNDSVPKISFGKAYWQGEQFILPIAIDVHHGLVDGFHVAKYLEAFQALLGKTDC